VDEHTKQSYQRFFKEEVCWYGVKSTAVGKIARKYFDEIQHRKKQEIWSLCEQLLASDYCEEAFIAFDWAYRLHERYEPADFDLFERWIGWYVNNWAKCDTLCNHTIGTFLEQYPWSIRRLTSWTGSGNRWFRRAAAVSLILPARKGLFISDIFEIADRLLMDSDDLVQKGYGWMLKEASKRYQTEVFEYVIAHKKEMPRTALRYAIEKMPGDLKTCAMEK
jgi:3-methyladenine DNA glycosylase AlkD